MTSEIVMSKELADQASEKRILDALTDALLNSGLFLSRVLHFGSPLPVVSNWCVKQ